MDQDSHVTSKAGTRAADNDDTTTTREDCTGTNVVKFGLPISHPSFTLSL